MYDAACLVHVFLMRLLVAKILIFSYSECENLQLGPCTPNTEIKTSCATLSRVSYHKHVISKSSISEGGVC
ncbi:hypothetical protein M758_6G053800 [Ceratodon purpureus]|uniref:Secreted protein n=1 Tax=Ceratodon purpureus TaxID=3225 RepID=A0A8T0HC04_CERPU|nr:hypothetical protein KC19_6G057700 [Ceratodon purpureus]KAG0612808.1 hypothetical protein M758_6G053800 [Ceratodon purpureus]